MKRVIDYNKKYPLLPLRDVVVYPHMVIPLFVGREKSISALDAAMKGDRLIILATQTDAQVTVPGKGDLFEVGTISEILQLLKLPDGTIKVLVEGLSRGYLSDFDDRGDYYEVGVKDMERPVDSDKETGALKRALLETFEKYIKLNKKVPQEALTTVNGIEDLSHLSDVVASYVSLRLELKQSLLEIGKPEERIEKLIELINGEIDIMYIEKKIQGKVRKQMEKTQKE